MKPGARRGRGVWRAWRAWAVAGVLVALGLGGWGLQARARAQEVAVARALTGGDPSRASAAIARHGCGGCHVIPGIAGAGGQVGPPLVKLRGRVYIGSGVRHTADSLVRWIVSPPSFSASSAMPATGIGEAEARDVAAWLYLD